MLDNSVPFAELALRGAIVYLALMIMMRLSGKRTVGQFTPFDLLVVMLLSESVSNSLSGGDESLIGGVFLAAVLISLNLLVAFFSSRSRQIAKVLEGSPVLIGRNRKWFEHVLRSNHVGKGDVEQALREADCDPADMECGFLEVDGKISILKKK